MSEPVARLNAALEGRYRIESELGEGGMATVYLADDLRHERKVALKVLKPELAAVVGAERFLAEIKTTANLQHPHILPLFDSGEAESFLFYVMPYVEGESLRERLDREHQLPVDEAVDITKNVAEALDYAHGQGVIHRDIKPANILLQAGKPVVSDFGIALALSAGGDNRLTETGLSLGTPHYMSPEQATGDLSVGAATDIYALGCVLYEMLVGDPPFTGSTPQAVLGKIIAGRLESVRDQRPSVPPNVDAVIRTALERVPADRFAGSADFSRALQNDTFRATETTAGSVTSGQRLWNPLAIGMTAVAALALGLFVWQSATVGVIRQERAVLRTTFPLPTGQELVLYDGPAPIALSPDGMLLAYVANVDGRADLYVRDLREWETRIVTGSEGARRPFFSPDGEWIAFFVGQNVFRVSLDGGSPVRVAETPPLDRGGTWSEDGTIVFDTGVGLYAVDWQGGTPEQLTSNTPEFDSADHQWPSFLPGRHGLLSAVGGSVAVLSAETNEWRVLIEGEQPRYLDSGHLLYRVGDDAMHAVPFDLETLTITGAARSVLDGVYRGQNGGAAFVDVSSTGTLVFVPGAFAHSLVVRDRQGRPMWVSDEPAGYRHPKFSPDGRSIAVTVDPRPSEIRVYDLERGSSRVIASEGHNLGPAWTRDGRWVSHGATGGNRLTAADGSGDSVLLPGGVSVPTSWAPGDDAFIFTAQSPTGRDIAMATLRGEVTPLLTGPSREEVGVISPSGRWLAYHSDEAGRFDVYLRPFPNVDDAKFDVSTEGGWQATWSADSEELFYMEGNRLMVVRLSTRAERPMLSAPEFLFEGPSAADSRDYDVAPDGQRFVMVEPDPDVSPTRINIVQNWFLELDRLVPRN